MEIQLVYASTSGNVETVVEKVAEVLKQHDWQPTLHRAEKTSIDVITNNSTFILATSTWEHGVINPFFKKLLDEIAKTDCSGKQAAFIGLGDRRYEPVLFTQGMETLREVWLKQGGQELGERLKIQGEPYAQLEQVVVPWAEALVASLPGAQNA